MVAELGLGLFNFARSAIFSTRNVDKSAHGDFVRAGVAAGQAKNALIGLSALDCQIGRGAGTAVKAIETAANSKNVITFGEKALHFGAKTVDFASRWVNPLLCVSGAVKVAMSDDKTSEAIKQSAALGTMFLFEATGRRLFMEPVRNKFMKTSLGKTKGVNSLLTALKKLDKFSKVAGKTSNWAKFGIPILKGITYVGMSITGYSLGAGAGNIVNDWRKEDSKRYQMASLTGVKPVSQAEINAIMNPGLNYKA